MAVRIMSWQQELITSKEQALDFICRHLSVDGVLLKLEDYSEGETKRLTPIVFKTEPDGSIDYDKQSVFFFDANDKPEGCLIDGFFVREDFQGKGFGLIGVKALLGAAYEFSSSTVILPFLTEDGPSFWPALGAIPIKEPEELSKHIANTLDDVPVSLSQEARQKLLLIGKISEESPYLGWRVLGTSDIPRNIRHRIFNEMCFHKDLRIIPGEPTTRKILQNRLGALPPFRAPNASGDYRHVQAAFRGINKISKEFGL
jgi:GNAT superfamily N-acetyltransferase